MKRDKNNLEYAKWIGLYYLGFRMHTQGEMWDKLRKKQIDEKWCAQAIEYFKEMGYIDDYDYAVRYIKDASNLKKQGPSRITQQLRLKKVDSDIIKRAFDDAEVDFGESLKRAMAIKAKSLDLSNRKDRDKLIGHLVRRGYKISEILAKLN